MTSRPTRGKKHRLVLRLIPLTTLLILACGVWLYGRILHPHSHLADTALNQAAMQPIGQQQLCDRCHPDSMRLRRPGSFIQASVQSIEGLDKYSIQCLGCHGKKADTYDETDAIVVASNQILSHGKLNHSIGRSYATAEIFGGYRPIGKLSKKIQLPNGVVSCISCHDASSQPHGKLVTPIDRSALCFECHDL